jgi:hypothetical protein
MSHSKDLGEKGRKNVTGHYYHGGVHVGSCAGSYMLSTMSSTYYNIWDGYIDMSEYNAGGTTTDSRLPDDSPLLNYGFDFGGDLLVAKVRLNNGGSVLIDIPSHPLPEGTEVLSLHENVPKNSKMDGHCNCWGWKDNDTTGRVIGICPHPESNSEGEIRDYMAATLLHAIAGMAPPDIKGELQNSRIRVMDQSTEDNDPQFTKIGDLQYHHFIINLEKDAKNLIVDLKGTDGFDMHLYLKKDSYAFDSCADYKATGSGATKAITVEVAEKGTWYVGANCVTTVTSTEKSSGSDMYYEYSGNLDVLNGVEYTIEAEWENTGIIALKKGLYNTEEFSVTLKNRIVFINVTNPEPFSLAVHDLKGRLCWTPKTTRSITRYTWKPSAHGMYIVRLKAGNDIVTRRVTFMR